jgi:hypothetical protein
VAGLVEIGELGADALRRREHVGQLGSVLPLEPEELVQPRAHLLEANRVVLDRARVVPRPPADLGERVVRVLQQPHVRSKLRVDGRKALERAPDLLEPRDQRVVRAVEDLVDAARALDELLGVLLSLRLGLERLVFAGRDAESVDLRQLEAQEVRPALHVAGARLPLVERSSELVQLGVQPRDTARRLSRAPVGVQDPALVGRAQERLVLMLAVQVDEGAAERAHGPGCRGGSADPGTVSPLRRHLAAQDEQAVLQPEALLFRQALHLGERLDVEDGLDRGALRSDPHDRGRRPLAEQQRERAYDDRLAGAGLPRERAQA